MLVSGVWHSDSMFLQIRFHYWLLQDSGYQSLCYIVGPYCLSKRHRFGDFPGGPVVKNPPANAGDMDSIPGL